MESISFQILSDLHLETPASRPTYSEFDISNLCPYLILLGDIGLVKDGRLFMFLEEQLQRFKIIFYVLGNHEPYDSTWLETKKAMKSFQEETDHGRPVDSPRGKFVLLDQVRYDLTSNLTILGCTLFSAIDPAQVSSIQMFVSDFARIQDWAIESHNTAHQSDLGWLNRQVETIAQNEPERKIVVCTHYSPTIQPEANSLRHLKDDPGVRFAFMTNLSNEGCWTSPLVTLWAFGHTHFNSDFVDTVTEKRIVANQKGYRRSEAAGFDMDKVVTVEIPQSLHRPAITSKSKLGKVGQLLKSLRPS